MNIKLIKRSLRLLFLSLALCAAVSGQKDRPVEIALGHKELGKAPTIAVNINGKTYPFMWDSGGGITIITPDVAKDLGCAPFGQITGFNAGGERIDMQRCDAVEMNVGGFQTKIDTGVLEIMPFFGPNTPPIGGYISLQTFKDRIITIDLAGDRLWVETEKSFARRIKDMKPLESRLMQSAGGAIIDIFFAANSPKGKIWMLFDTGNYSTLLFAPPAQEMLGINFDAPNRAKMTKPVKLDVVGLGAVEMPGRERQMIYDGMLNFDTISKWTVTIDLRSGRAWAKINPAPSEAQK